MDAFHPWDFSLHILLRGLAMAFRIDNQSNLSLQEVTTSDGNKYLNILSTLRVSPSISA